jgi:hypothetical protein
MLLQKKALYNLIQLNLPRIESGDLQMGELQNWQKENYRDKSLESLFQQLKSLGIHLSLEQWQEYGSISEDPEQIVEALANQRNPLEKDQIFLVIFELWRRYFPEKRTLSIFCDELDNQMMAYDLGKPNQVADSLAYLEQILDEHVDRGLLPHKAFELIQMYCAGDISSFLFDYILAEIDAGNHTYATDLLDGFRNYIQVTPWFSYLEARTILLQDPEEGYERLEKMLANTPLDTPVELLEEILFFLANSGNHSLFYACALKTLPLLRQEGEFKEFLEACYAHYDFLELKKPALAIARLFHNRSKIPIYTPLNPCDSDLTTCRTILDQKLHFAEE